MSQVIHFLKYGVTACLLSPSDKQEWPPDHQWVGEQEIDSVNCPVCLQGMQYGDPTFQIIEDGKAIRCCRCGSVSYSPKDIEQHWCGRCNMSHDDIWPPARRAWVQSYAIPS
jgi:ribosomal protein L37E